MRINHKPLLIATALLTLVPNVVWSSPFDEDQEICPQWECDQAEIAANLILPAVLPQILLVLRAINYILMGN